MTTQLSGGDQVLLATEDQEVSVGKQVLPAQASQTNFTLSVVCCSEYAELQPNATGCCRNPVSVLSWFSHSLPGRVTVDPCFICGFVEASPASIVCKRILSACKWPGDC